MSGNGYLAGLHVVNVIAQMLMQCQGNGSIYFVIVHGLYNVCELALHRDVTMLLGGQGIAFCCQLSQATADAETRVTRFDDIVDIAILGSLVGVSEELVVLDFFLGDESLHVLTGLLLGLSLLGVEHGGSTTGTHDGNLC